MEHARDEDIAFIHSITRDKYDPELGEKVAGYLNDLTLLPLPGGYRYDPRAAVEDIAEGIKCGMQNLGLDMDDDPSLKDTPHRYAHMLVGELTVGLNFSMFPKCTLFPSDGYNQMVFLGNIATMSLCEHHLQTIDGFTHIAYIPNERMFGISKLARITDFFARRPQVQERMTEQIFHALCFILGTDDVAVVQNAAHYCMRARGSMQHASMMSTDKMGGRFMTNPALRGEFLNAIARL